MLRGRGLPRSGGSAPVGMDGRVSPCFGARKSERESIERKREKEREREKDSVSLKFSDKSLIYY